MPGQLHVYSAPEVALQSIASEMCVCDIIGAGNDPRAKPKMELKMDFLFNLKEGVEYTITNQNTGQVEFCLVRDERTIILFDVEDNDFTIKQIGAFDMRES